MNLEYQLSNGDWLEAGEHTDRLIGMAVAELERCHDFNPRLFPVVPDYDQIVTQLQQGEKISIGEDWHANIRNKPEPRAKWQLLPRRPPVICSSCGRTGHTGAYPFSTAPGVCDDCV